MQAVGLMEPRTFEAGALPYATGDQKSLTASSFARLLERLHPEPEQAALEYERLRRSLVKFFDWRGGSPADECADETLDRLARRLEQTAVQDVHKYVHGIARLVLLERLRAPAFSSLDHSPSVTLTAPPPAEGNHLQDCFDRCLAQLPEESRLLLLRYYEGERRAKISNRRRLASMLGVTENALRSRVQRLRDRLEQCVESCATHAVSHTP